MRAYRLAHEFALNSLPHPLKFPAKRGRWNSDGWRIAYMSEHPALAALEMLGYWDDYTSMRGYHLIQADFPETLIEDAGHLDPTNEDAARAFGDQWLQEGRSLVLRVRSVTVPESFNLLVNSAHKQMKALTATDLGAFDYDARIHRLLKQAKR